MIFLLVCSYTTTAQSIKRSTICSFGSSSFVGTRTLRQSVGQPSNTASETSLDLTLRQGFQQPLNSGVQYFEKENCNLSIYPNPSIDGIISFSTGLTTDLEFKISVFDSQGAIVHMSQLTPTQNNMNLNFLSPGLYTVIAETANTETCSNKLIIVK